jgi:hypothetical protein
MTGIAKINRVAPRPLRLRWWQAGKAARIDCTSFTCEVAETDLPFTPGIAPVNLALGEFDILAPSLNDAALLDPQTTYRLSLRLMNAGGQPVEFMRMSVGVE